MLRVAMFAPHYAEYVTRLALELSKTNDVLLILDKKNRTNELGASIYESAKATLRYFEFRSDTRIGRRISRATVAARILLFRPDVVHVQEQPDQLTSIIVSILRRFYPIFLTVHDPKPHVGNDAEYAVRWRKYRENIRNSAYLHHVHGRHCSQLMEAEGVPAPLIVETFHGPILIPLLDQTKSSRIGRILFFGRMEKYKGLDLLLEAAKYLSGLGRAYEFVLAGRGEELDRLHSTIETLANVTVINRFLTPDEAIDQFQQAAVVVLPYREATQSGVVAAAFANGRPVVATAVGGLVDVIENNVNGLLITPDSHIDLAEALDQILSDESLRVRLATGALDTGLHTLSWTGICRILAEAYDRRPPKSQ